MKDERKLKFLCRRTVISNPIPHWRPKTKSFEFSLDEEISRIHELNKNMPFKLPQLIDRAEILRLFKKLNYSDEDALLYWWDEYSEQRSIKKEYDKKPIRVRKDNKDSINYGSGRSNKNTIRFPKKVRESAWKRFYKLFPKLKKEK